MTDAFFKNLEIQKEMGQAFWACPSCISFASTFGAKVNQKLKEVNDRVDALQEKVDNNTIGLGEVQERVDTVEETVQKAEKAVEKVEKTVTDMAKELESGMYQEMRAREAIKRNLVIYGVKEPDQRLTDSKDKMEADKDECEKNLHCDRIQGQEIRHKVLPQTGRERRRQGETSLAGNEIGDDQM